MRYVVMLVFLALALWLAIAVLYFIISSTGGMTLVIFGVLALAVIMAHYSDKQHLKEYEEFMRGERDD